MPEKRSCPVCGSSQAASYMKFTPDVICQMNSSYKSDVFKQVLSGNEDQLTYSKCQVCGMLYCEHTWEDALLSKVYENSIDHDVSREKTLAIDKRLELHREWERVLQVLAIRGMDKFDHLKLIDFGCGWGNFLDVVSGYGVSAMGLDSDRIKIEFARERGHQIANDVEALKSFGPVDVLVMNTVIEHIQDVDSVMHLAQDLLKPNGILVFSTMDFRPSFLKKNKNYLEAGLPLLTMHLNPVEHVNVYDYRFVRKTLDRYQFRLVGTGVTLDWAGMPIPYLRNTRTFIKCLNALESFVSKFIQGKAFPIIVYATQGAGDG